MRERVREFPISYVPQQNVQAINRADAISVEVKIEDFQPDESTRSGTRSIRFHKSKFSRERRWRYVKGAAETELRARGFKIGTGGALVTVQLDRFEALCEYSIYRTARAAIFRCGFRSKRKLARFCIQRWLKARPTQLPRYLFFHTLIVPHRNSKDRLGTRSGSCSRIPRSRLRFWRRVRRHPPSPSSVQAVSPALSPQCRDVDSKHLGRFFQRHRLLEHDLDMPALHLLERVTVIELVR